ncbi:hypothetical protein BC940DRAFT_233026 [Gongronella butleri]|nr:hypothetical protein BC940DRAFT_233026 [Gongronella butleri]
MDGIGTTLSDRMDHILIESSGLADGQHTEEDTLKLLEYKSLCLQEEKGHYQQASHVTFSKRRCFAIQIVRRKVSLLSIFVGDDDRWNSLWVRSALIPDRWDQRIYWFQAFEFLAKIIVTG